MKTAVYVILALVALAVFVFWVVPAAIHLLVLVALVLGVAAIIYAVANHYGRKNRARLAVGGQAKTERRAQKTAEKSLKAMERTLAASTSPAAAPAPAEQQNRR